MTCYRKYNLGISLHLARTMELFFVLNIKLLLYGEKRRYLWKKQAKTNFFPNSRPEEKTNVYLSTLPLKSEIFCTRCSSIGWHLRSCRFSTVIYFPEHQQLGRVFPGLTPGAAMVSSPFLNSYRSNSHCLQLSKFLSLQHFYVKSSNFSRNFEGN